LIAHTAQNIQHIVDKQRQRQGRSDEKNLCNISMHMTLYIFQIYFMGSCHTNICYPIHLILVFIFTFFLFLFFLIQLLDCFYLFWLFLFFCLFFTRLFFWIELMRNFTGVDRVNEFIFGRNGKFIVNFFYRFFFKVD